MTRASYVIFWFVLLVAASAMLYHTSYRVHDLNKQLYALHNAIEAEQRTIHVLKAEWVYLSNPSRIEKEAKRHLSLTSADLQQVTKMAGIPELIPANAEAMAIASAGSKPIASFDTPKVMPAPTVSSTYGNKLASADDDSHVNTHMIIQRSSNSSVMPSSSLILATFGNKP